MRLMNRALLLAGVSLAAAAAAQAQPRAYVTSQTSDERIWVVETVTNTVIDTVTVEDIPSRVAITPDGALAYVTIVVNEDYIFESGASLYSSLPPSPVLMATALSKSASVVSSASHGKSSSTHGKSTQEESSLSDSLFSNKVAVIDTETLALVATVTTEELAPFGIAITPGGDLAYVAHLSGGVSVIDTQSQALLTTIPLGGEALDVAITPDGAFAYVAASSSDAVVAIDTATQTVLATIEVGETPNGIAIMPDGRSAYVTNMGSDTVSRISIPEHEVVATLPAGGAPGGIAVTPDGAAVYVANQLSNDVMVIDTEANTVLESVAVGNTPIDLSITPNGRLVYVTNLSSHDVSVIDTTTNTVVDTVEVGFLPEGIAITPDQPMRSVTIDVRPGTPQNRFNVRAEGGIWVALLSDGDFDALEVDVGSVRFGPGEARPVLNAARDIDGDGAEDLLLRFRIQEAGLECGDTEVTLIGETYLQEQIVGTDSVTLVGCPKGAAGAAGRAENPGAFRVQRASSRVEALGRFEKVEVNVTR